MLQKTLLFVTTLLTGLSAGLFYAYACSVNPGLHRLPDAGYLSAMQNVNRAILNPAFFLIFMGPAFLLPVCAGLAYRWGTRVVFQRLLWANGFYILGVFGVTLFGNVPLNQTLDGLDLIRASPQDLSTWRTAFEGPWNNWHRVRTIAAVLALAFALGAVSGRRAAA